MGRAHDKGLLMPLFVLQKILKFKYNLSRMGNYYYQINNSTAENQKFGHTIIHILFLSKKIFPIDTENFTPSFERNNSMM